LHTEPQTEGPSQSGPSVAFGCPVAVLVCSTTATVVERDKTA